MAERCGVAGCTNEAARSFPAVRVTEAGLSLADEKARRAGLCRDHYKKFKKATKEDRELERLAW
jgi:hypothetical protein